MMSLKNGYRLLFLVRNFPPEYRGGVPNYYYNLILNLKNTTPFVVTSESHAKKDSTFDQDFTRASKCSIERKPFFPECMDLQISFKWLASLICMILSIIKTVRKKKVDIIIIGQARMFLLLSAFLSSVIMRKKYFLFLHGEEIPQFPMRSNFILRWLYMQAQGCFCNSNFTKNRFVDFLGGEKIPLAIITPGVEEIFFKVPTHSNLNLSVFTSKKRKKIIYTIARLDQRKGQDMVIKSLPKVIEKNPDILYLIGGRGAILQNLKKLVEDMGLNAYVCFLGFVSDNELLSYHCLCDIFVMPNRILENGDTEGFGIVFLEANAAGVPVIGGHAGGSVDAIVDGETGFLVDPMSKKDIAEKICFLLDNDGARIEMGQKGRKRAWEKFRWPSLAREFEKALANIWRDKDR